MILVICVIIGAVLSLTVLRRIGIKSLRAALLLLRIQFFGDLIECLFDRFGVRLDRFGNPLPPRALRLPFG